MRFFLLILQTNTLQQIAQANTTLSEFTFYTNGSVTNFGNSRCSMGIAWIQIYNNSIIHQFSAQIQNWSSLYKAELTAILLAICTCSQNSIIYIYTDSQSIISKYKALLNAKYNTSKIYSYNYWPIWHTLLYLIQLYSNTITLYKVLAHSDNEFNNFADQLAKTIQIFPFYNFFLTTSITLHFIYNINNLI